MTDVLIEDHGATRLLTLNRPASLNAISRQLGRALISEFDRADADPEVRVLVLSGSGERAFSAGGDLKERVDTSETLEERRAFASALLQRRRSTPSIAAVNGLAFGGGLELLLTCDFALSVPDARFALPEATRGILASGGGLLRLPQAIGRQRATRMALTGEPIDAKTAFGWGLITEIVPREELLPRALALAEEVAKSAPLAVEASRRVIDSVRGDDDPAWALNTELATQIGASDDAQEGPRAFAAKRAPRWSGT